LIAAGRKTTKNNVVNSPPPPFQTSVIKATVSDFFFFSFVRFFFSHEMIFSGEALFLILLLSLLRDIFPLKIHEITFPSMLVFRVLLNSRNPHPPSLSHPHPPSLVNVLDLLWNPFFGRGATRPPYVPRDHCQFSPVHFFTRRISPLGGIMGHLFGLFPSAIHSSLSLPVQNLSKEAAFPNGDVSSFS